MVLKLHSHLHVKADIRGFTSHSSKKPSFAAHAPRSILPSPSVHHLHVAHVIYPNIAQRTCRAAPKDDAASARGSRPHPSLLPCEAGKYRQLVAGVGSRGRPARRDVTVGEGGQAASFTPDQKAEGSSGRDLIQFWAASGSVIRACFQKPRASGGWGGSGARRFFLSTNHARFILITHRGVGSDMSSSRGGGGGSDMGGITRLYRETGKD